MQFSCRITSVYLYALIREKAPTHHPHLTICLGFILQVSFSSESLEVPEDSVPAEGRLPSTWAAPLSSSLAERELSSLLGKTTNPVMKASPSWPYLTQLLIGGPISIPWQLLGSRLQHGAFGDSVLPSYWDWECELRCSTAFMPCFYMLPFPDPSSWSSQAMVVLVVLGILKSHSLIDPSYNHGARLEASKTVWSFKACGA